MLRPDVRDRCQGLDMFCGSARFSTQTSPHEGSGKSSPSREIRNVIDHVLRAGWAGGHSEDYWRLAGRWAGDLARHLSEPFLAFQALQRAGDGRTSSETNQGIWTNSSWISPQILARHTVEPRPSARSWLRVVVVMRVPFS